MKFLISCLSLLIASNLYGQCNLPNGRVLKNGESETLFKTGGSLEKFQTQDQDGLNTCYANTLSAVIHSIDPSHPNPSYLDIALTHGTSGKYSSWVTTEPTKNYMKKWSSNIDGVDVKNESSIMAYGWGCNALEALKQSGGVCPRDAFSFENDLFKKYGEGQDKNEFQREYFYGLMDYFDYKRKNGKNLDQAQIDKDFASVFKYLDEKKTKEKERCEKAKANGKSDTANNWIKAYIDNKIWKLVSYAEAKNLQIGSTESLKDPCYKKTIDFLNSFLSSPMELKDGYLSTENSETNPNWKSKIESNLNRADVKQSISKMDQQVNSDQFYGRTVTNSNSVIEDPIVIETTKKIGSYVYPDIMSEVDKSFTNNECKEMELKDTTDVSYQHQRDLVSESHLRAPGACERFNQLSPLSRDYEDAFQNMQDKGYCSNNEHIKYALRAVMPLMKLEMDAADIINKLKTPIQEEDVIKKLIAPECAKQKVPVDHLACATVHFCDFGDQIRQRSKGQYAGTAGKCLDVDQARDKFQEVIYTKIKKGHATVLNICTDFLDNPDFSSSFCQAKDTQGGKYGGHAVTVTGYKCDGKTMKYEVLNSWGKVCPVSAEQGYKNHVFECELGSDGLPTGRFWVKEENLLNNTAMIQSVWVK